MKELYVRDIQRLCNGEIIIGNENDILNEFVRDTREIKQGDVFIGIKGENVDGNLLFEEAIKNGAKVCILQKENIINKINTKEIEKKYTNVTIVLVENTIKALQELAKYKRSLYNIPVIAVTGSVGKTSTKDIISSVMSKKYNVLKTEGNLNNQIGLPLTILKLKDHNAMVLEMGMSELGEISNLSKIAKPTIAVITNVGTAHIGRLGSRENILKAKLEILDGLKENGYLILNNDNDMLHNWVNEKENKDLKLITYGIKNDSNYVAKEIETTERGSIYKINMEEKEYEVKVGIGGLHFVLNSLCAIAVGNILKINMNDILKGIDKFELTKRRMQIEKNKIGATIINDCYNANYDSMKAGLEYLEKMKNKRKIAVLGDMLELGKFSEMLHEKVGEEVVKNKIDLLITVGKLAQDIARKALKEGMKKENVIPLQKNEEAIKKLKEIMSKNDAILIKASNAMNFQEIFEKICK